MCGRPEQDWGAPDFDLRCNPFGTTVNGCVVVRGREFPSGSGHGGPQRLRLLH